MTAEALPDEPNRQLRWRELLERATEDAAQMMPLSGMVIPPAVVAYNEDSRTMRQARRDMRRAENQEFARMWSELTIPERFDFDAMKSRKFSVKHFEHIAGRSVAPKEHPFAS